MAVQSLTEKLDGLTMISSWNPRGPCIVNRTTFQHGNVSCVIGVRGKGTLQLLETEFDELLEEMNEVARVRDGGEPTTTEDTRE